MGERLYEVLRPGGDADGCQEVARVGLYVVFGVCMVSVVPL